MIIMVRVSEFLTETMNSTLETVSDPTFHLLHPMERILYCVITITYQSGCDDNNGPCFRVSQMDYEFNFRNRF